VGRIGETLDRTRREHRLALVAFLTAGYPEPAATPGLVRALADGGADLIELGIPFSDPLADGSTIQRADFRALEAGITPAACLHLARNLRNEGLEIPLVLMGYYNPLLAYGLEAFVADAARSGVDGLIAVDLPPEEGEELRSLCTARGLDLVPLLAPTSDERRTRLVVERASGFVYCVSVTGVTGARQALPADLPQFLRRVRTHTSLPLAVGFGISRREHLEALEGLAEAAVVGSAIIEVIERSPPSVREERVKEYVGVLTGRRGARV
jgi:tryptophan synthase alpha subunit